MGSPAESHGQANFLDLGQLQMETTNVPVGEYPRDASKHLWGTHT